jgi:hypothetical protein
MVEQVGFVLVLQTYSVLFNAFGYLDVKVNHTLQVTIKRI